MAGRGVRSGDGTALSAAAAPIVGAVRDGTLPAGTVLTDEVLLLENRVPPAMADRLVDHLVDLGIATRRPDRAVVVQGPDAAAWTDTMRLSLTLLEGAVRSAVPRLSDDEVTALLGLLDRVESLAGLREHETASALRAVSRFWLDRTPNEDIRRQWTGALDRASALAPNPLPLREWRATSYARTLAHAVRERDVDLACDAVHELVAALDRELPVVASDPGTPPTGHVARLDGSDETFWAVLGALRSHVWPVGTEIRLSEIVTRLGSPGAEVLSALDRVEEIGLVRFTGDRTVVVRAVSPDEYAGALDLHTVLHEACVRWTIPVLSEEDRDRFGDLVATARRRGATRDLGSAESVLDVVRFFTLRVPVAVLRSAMLRATGRLAFALDPSPRFRQWDIEDYLGPLLAAVRSDDVELGVEAVHGMFGHVARHADDIREHWRPGDD